ncbi:pectate lyase [Prevotella pectinovora]|nr:pectate lyase [Prevotella pectinovora]
MKNLCLPLVALALSASASAQTGAPAFPGAEGFARYAATGGRAADGTTKVYHVTNLNDSGTGSLRWALSQSGPRTIVFDVSGYIDLKSNLKISSNTTIAGQTAPGNGITLRYYTVEFTNCDNVIVRFLRFRRSQVKHVDDGADATWGRYRKNILIDHCSMSWSIDELASFYDNRDFTLQWCMLAEGLNAGHAKGDHSYGGIWGGKPASFHHNFLAHVQNRAPRFNGARYNWNGYDKTQYSNSIQAERVDFRNCVVYNWGNGNGCYGGPGGGYVNMVNNYFKAGPGTKNKTRVTQISFSDASNGGDNPFPNYSSRYFISGNYVSAAGSKAANYDWSGVIYDQKIKIGNDYYMQDAKHYYGEDQTYVKDASGVDCIKIKLDSQFDPGTITTQTAETAYEKVLAYSGASLYRDACDVRYVEEATNGTVTYNASHANVPGIIDVINDPYSDSQNSATASFPELPSESRAANYDTDGDGIPDEWEIANGLNPDDPSDAQLKTLDTAKGWYSNLEVYLNSIVEHIVKSQNADAVSPVDEYYPAFTSGISASSTKSEVKSIEYYSLNGVRLSEPQQGISIRKMVLTDGQTVVDKVLKK